ncbi:MAG: class I SAM-dependent methyltransferase [Alphaproteobacteria bacterium]
MDIEQRRQGLPAVQRMCAITPDTGKFLALLAAAAPTGEFLEIGTSGGYSALWLALACAKRGQKLTTFELRDHKVDWARETFHAAGIEPLIDLVVGDAREHLSRYKNVSFCFLDATDDVYVDCYELVVPNMVAGGLVVADNVVTHADECKTFVDHVMADPRVDALIVPIGKGELVARKI